MTNLQFCSNIAYAAPHNPVLFPDTSALAAKYDAFASAVYANFTKSLAQIPCNTTRSAQYSLAKGCKDCAEAYKTWLCTVIMPRCDDFGAPLMNSTTTTTSSLSEASSTLTSSSLSNLVFRNAESAFFNGTGPPNLDDYGIGPSFAGRRYFNHSRIDWIDEVIQPGPYRELLPCLDICWAVVRACPASFGFSCPQEGPSLEWAYASQGRCNNVSQDITIGPGGESGAVLTRRSVGGGYWGAVGVVGLVATSFAGFAF